MEPVREGKERCEMNKVEMIMSKCGVGRVYAEQVQGDYELSVEVGGAFTIYRLTRLGKEIKTPTPVGGWINAIQ